MAANLYETDALLQQYLLFHYGKREEILPYDQGPHDALDYAARVIHEIVERDELVECPRGLDLGCAVGRSSFEMSCFCKEVIAIDRSASFIAAAKEIQQTGALKYPYVIEGGLYASAVASPPTGSQPENIQFEEGDALNLRQDIGQFDLLLLANLIDRVNDPQRCLAQLSAIARPGAQLIITSPYTWREEFTPKEKWLSQGDAPHASTTSLENLQAILGEAFELIKRVDMPFLIREHARKFQWSVAEATHWRRKG